MLIDGRLVPRGATLRADVVVIGAGPAGITITQELAATGMHVMLVEAAGRHHGRADDDALGGDSSAEPFPLVRSRHRGFGGTSTHWTPSTGLRVRPLDAVDFTARSGRSHDGWPFGVDAMKPFYDRAHERLGVSPEYRPDHVDGVSASPLTWPGGPQLAMFRFTDHHTFVDRYDDVVADPNIDLVLNTSVRELDTDPDGRIIRRAEAVCADGNEFFAEAVTFVLACGGIDNARILLASPGRDGRGVGNEHDNVGRYFMDHLSIDTGIIEPTDASAISAEPFAEYRSVSGRVQAMLWLGNEIIEREGLPNAAFWINEVDLAYLSPGVGAARSMRTALRSTHRRDAYTHLMRAVRGSPSIAAFAFRKVTRRSPRPVLAMRIMTEQLPDRESRIQLSERRDRLGMRRVDLHWRVSPLDLDVVVAHQEHLGRLLEERGVATLGARFDPSAPVAPVMSNYHHMGSTRMHVDPRRGVVDPDGRVHSAANLFVVGSSVFPTGGYLNPTLTIMALALKAADAVLKQHRPLAVQSAR